MNTESESEPVSVSAYAGAWRRLGACAIDVVVLGLSGIAMGFLLFLQLAQTGAWGRLIGFLIALTYFGILNSKLAGGQTPGKRVARIRVVGTNGQPLSLQMSLLRFVPLGVPWFLNGAMLPPEVINQPLLLAVLSAAIFGVGLSIIYLFLFNRPSRRSLHDLLAGSVVVAANAAEPVSAPRPGRAHLVAVIAFLAVAAILPWLVRGLFPAETLASLTRTLEAVNAAPEVSNATIQKGWSGLGDRRTTYLSIHAQVRDGAVDDPDRAKQLARIALEADPTLESLDLIVITLVYGFDIGFASATRSQTFQNPPAAWMSAPPE